VVFSGQLVGIREVEEKIWLVSFLDFDLGYFDEKEGRVEPGPNPFTAKVLTMSSVACKGCVRNGPSKTGAAKRIRTPDPRITNS
jgi:hypothetical protein